MALTEQEKQVLHYVDELGPKYLEFASQLIAIPTENPPGTYDAIASKVDGFLTGEGFSSRVVMPPPELTAAAGHEADRYSVIASLSEETSSPNLGLVIHLDTVPAGPRDLWAMDPFEGVVTDGRLWGRGACDCKGRLASFALAMATLKESGARLNGSVTLLATADEEIGGYLGLGYIMDQELVSLDYALVEGFIEDVLYGYAGGMSLRLVIAGEAAHSSEPWQGSNAIVRMHSVLTEILRLQEELKSETSAIPEMRYTTVNIGVIRGGEKATIVPNRCVAEIDFRVIPEQSCEELVQRVRSAVARLDGSDDWLTITVMRARDSYMSSPDGVLGETLGQASLDTTGRELNFTACRGGSDMCYLISHGISALAYGPGNRSESRLHAPNENIKVEDFINAAKVVVVTALRLLR